MPTISEITMLGQGLDARLTDATVKESIVEIQIDTLTADNNCNIEVEISFDAGSNWLPVLLHASGNGIDVSTSGGAVGILVDVRSTFAQDGFPSLGTHTAVIFRLRAYDPVLDSTSAWAETSETDIKSSIPTISSLTMGTYVNAAQASTASLVIDSAGGPTRFLANLSASNLDFGTSLSFQDLSDGNVAFAFPAQTADGAKTLYVRVYDEFYNASTISTVSTWLQRTPPQAGAVTIIGSVGNSDYTGIAIAEDGSFSVDREAVLRLRATSPLATTLTILPGSNVETAANVNTPIVLNATNASQVVNLTTNPANPTADNFNADATVSVSVRFEDAAGNTSTVSSSIRLNTRIYETAYSPMRQSSAEYQLMLREVTTGGSEIVIPKSLILDDELLRLWPDTFYPASHGYPLGANGLVDSAAAIAMEGASDASYDAVLVENDELVLDDEGRPITVDWTSDGTKNYGHMLSAGASNIQYWILDATGYGEFRLELEHFNLDPSAYGPPFNTAAPHRGDTLVVYDGTATGAVVEEDDEFGIPGLVLGNSALLSEIHAFTGSGSNVVDLTNGVRMNSGPNGSFTTGWIRGMNKIVLILYTDAAASASGFKLKASKGYEKVWSNYDVDYANGEIWVHKHSSLGTASGAADTTAKRAVYDYLDNPIVIDYETGTVKFAVAPSGTPIVDADYTCHAWDESPSSLWVASHDDFVDYAEAPLYLTVGASGQSISDADKASKLYELDGYGRVTTGAVWDKDRGVVELADDSVPSSGTRMLADYSHHTYKRLSNDGYGDLAWRDSVIVADDTPLYRDFTFADIKVVNEGDAMLEDAQLKFVPRGYDTNNDNNVILEGSNVVDQVLDINRPWDVQKGTRQETYERMAVEVQENYLWNRTATKTEAKTALGVWQTRVYGDIPARGTVYGRCVWVLGGTSGTNYPSTSAGKKRVSIEATGRYYSEIVI